MNAKAEPTPRPWFRGRKDRMAIDAAPPDLSPGEFFRIAKLHTSPFSPAAGVCEANADLIVRAVNSFDGMLAALEAAREYVALGVAHTVRTSADGRKRAGATLAQLEAVIAKAKGAS